MGANLSEMDNVFGGAGSGQEPVSGAAVLSPSISVLMPVFNPKKFVAVATESVLAQTLTDFDFLIIDDGSTDSSLSILKRYAESDRRIRLISRPNRGLIDTLNEMISLSSGEFLARMDPDDPLPSNTVRSTCGFSASPQRSCCGRKPRFAD